MKCIFHEQNIRYQLQIILIFKKSFKFSEIIFFKKNVSNKFLTKKFKWWDSIIGEM